LIDGKEYKGSFKNDQFNGPGSLKLEDKKTFEGVFEDGKAL
jgi:hypothetical protein